MEDERREVIYTLEPHYDAGMFDNTQEEWKTLRAQHEGYLLSWEHESRRGCYGENEDIVVGVIEDAITHEIVTIPQNRIRFK